MSNLDPMAGKYTICEFKRDFETAKARLAPLGGTFIVGTHNFEAFVWKGDGVKLLFYPHKTSAGNRHLRVRTAGAFKPAALRAAIFALAENTCTFQFPADPQLHGEAVRAALQREFKSQASRVQTNG